MSLKQNIIEGLSDTFPTWREHWLPEEMKVLEDFILSKLSIIEQEVMKEIDERKGVIFNNKDYYNKVFSGEDMHYVLLVLEERIKRLFD